MKFLATPLKELSTTAQDQIRRI